MSKDTQKLAEMLDPCALRRLAGTRSYERGVGYHDQGRVLSPTEYNGLIAAKVRGTQDYAVKLWVEDGRVQHSCTCPMGDDGAFCKHCVAVALELVEGKRSGTSPRAAKTTVTMDDVRAHLAHQDRDSLVELLMEQALEHADLRRRLLMQAAKESPKGLDLGPFYAAIDDAVLVTGFVDYREAHAYVSGINRVVSSLRDLLTEERATQAMEVVEYAISKVEEAMGSVDDSDGDMGSVLCDLQELHHEACVLASPDPVALAEKLFRWETCSDWEVFLDAADTYAAVLGKAGLARYRELVEAEWKKVAPLSPGQDDESKYGTRWRITSIMEGFARRAGDTVALIEIMTRDLSTAYDFLQIAEVCKKARRREEALRWAERGAAAFPKDADWRLREFLAEEYHRLRRHDEAMALIWAEFAEHPNLGLYQELKKHADRCKQWPAWRERAFGHVRETIAGEKAEAKPHRPSWYASVSDSSALVEILLWEKDSEGAWQEAQAGGCSDRLWRQLAAMREKNHPEDALRIYQAAVEPTIDLKSNDAYKEAVNLLHKMRGIMVRLNRGAEFQQYLESVRVAHTRKRNFTKLLDAAKWT
jgi:uncharacterized Zn finger protein